MKAFIKRNVSCGKEDIWGSINLIVDSSKQEIKYFSLPFS